MEIPGSMVNRSMLEYELMTPTEKIQKQFRVNYIDDHKVFAPVGHVYSVMVEELRIEKPNIDLFMKELNEYISIGGDGWAKVKSASDQLSSRTAGKLSLMLYNHVKDKKISKENARNIIISAVGGYDAHNWTHTFR